MRQGGKTARLYTQNLRRGKDNVSAARKSRLTHMSPFVMMPPAKQTIFSSGSTLASTHSASSNKKCADSEGSRMAKVRLYYGIIMTKQADWLSALDLSCCFSPLPIA